MIRFLFDLLGLLLILAGILLFVSPVPVGLIVVGMGVLVLSTHEERVRLFIQRQRKKHRNADQAVRLLARHLPLIFVEILHTTDPA